jgi:hypothetical protein
MLLLSAVDRIVTLHGYSILQNSPWKANLSIKIRGGISLFHH